MGPSVSITAPEFRLLCSRFATGITVITTVDNGGQPHGFTANSFTSVSLEPPLILFCIDRQASVYGRFLQAEWIAVNVLDETQRSLSVRFSAPVEARFEGIAWTRGLHGVPLLDGTIATIEASITSRIKGGDHDIFLARVVRGTCGAGQPLVYFGGEYRTLA